MKSSLSFALSCVLFAQVAAAASPASRPAPQPPPPRTHQEIVLLAAGFSAKQQILLTLNNNRSEQMQAALTLYTENGTAYALTPATLISRESKHIDLDDLARAAGLSHQRLGLVKVEYEGILMELGAQLTIYPTPNGSAFDSPRSLSVDYKSANRSAAFALPVGSETTISLSNVSQVPIDVVLNCGTLSATYAVGPNGTKTAAIPTVAFGILPLQRNKGFCDISANGPIDALRAIGVVRAGQYAAPVRFYDPSTATSTNITSVGLRTSLDTRVVMHNTSDLAVEYKSVVRAATVSNPQAEELAPGVLPPHGTVSLDVADALQALQEQGVSTATLTASSQAAPGSLVGALNQVDADGVVEDIPFRTSNPPRFDRGTYPIRWEDDYQNNVTITNTSSQSRGYRATITAGTMIYVLPKVNLEPNASMTYDLNKLRTDQTPDLFGAKLPLDALYGKFIWSELSDGRTTGLLGRTSVTSRLHRRRSSFSCGSECWGIHQAMPYFTPVFWYAEIPSGMSQTINITEHYWGPNQPEYAYPYYYSSLINDNQAQIINPDSGTVFTMSADPSSATNLILTANNPGVASESDLYVDYYTVYRPADVECDMAVDSFVEGAPVYSQPYLTCPPVVRGGITTCTASGTSGTTFSDWTFTDGSSTVYAYTGSTAKTWSGVIAKAGSVFVTAHLPDNSQKYLVAPIVVFPRSMAFSPQSAQKVSVITNQVDSQGNPINVTIPSTPSVSDPRAGEFGASGKYSYSYELIAGGPNAGFRYVTGVTDQGSFQWLLAADLENTGSDFYHAQCGNFNPTTNPNGFMSGMTLYADTVRHESDGTAQSHYINYKSAFLTGSANVGAALEDITSFNSTNAAFEASANSAAASAITNLITAAQAEPCGTTILKGPGCSNDGYVNLYKASAPHYDPCI